MVPFFEGERAAGRPLALATVLRTAGSTYRKAGAQMLIGVDGSYAGLLSGGCLEGDLAERARRVIDTGLADIVTYDLRKRDDVLWGIGVGCEGAMDILLTYAGPRNAWEPIATFTAALREHRRVAAALVVDSAGSPVAAGSVALFDAASGFASTLLATDGSRNSAPAILTELLRRACRCDAPQWLDEAGLKVFATPLALPPRLLLLGGGPDVLPLVEFGARLGWKFTVVDHRPAYSDPSRLPGAAHVLCLRPEDLAASLNLADYVAAIVMSHHLTSDLEYLRALASSRVPYVGLLGPVARRERLLGELGETARLLKPRLRAPVGLAIGGRTPESIALAIVAEIHAVLHGAKGGPLLGAPDTPSATAESAG